EARDVSLPARDLRSNPGGVDVPTAPGPSLARGLWRIAAADVSSGNRVALLRDGPATFDAMLDLVDSAKASVALESYIFRSDDVGELLARTRCVSAARGSRRAMGWRSRGGRRARGGRSPSARLDRRARYFAKISETIEAGGGRHRPGQPARPRGRVAH